MIKKLIALVLALTLCVGLVACGGETADTPDSDAAVPDYQKAFAKYDPNTTVMTINGETVTWSEFYYMLYSAVSELIYYNMGTISWEDEVLEGYGISFKDYSMQLTMDSLKQFHAISKQAVADNVSLSEADVEKMNTTMADFKTRTCGEGATDEAFEAFLLENLFLTPEVYSFINVNAMLYEKLFDHYIGTKAEKLTDGDVAAFVKKAPYVTCKHILIKTIDESGAALPEEQKTAAREKAEGILEQLQGIHDQKTLAETFNTLMIANTEDEGTSMFTEGYTFTYNQMYPVFEQAAFALEEYQISGIVESEAGYHILLRLPTQRTSAVDYDYQNGVMYTVETYAATDKYSQLIKSWMNETEVVWEPEFEGITADKLFE